MGKENMKDWLVKEFGAKEDGTNLLLKNKSIYVRGSDSINELKEVDSFKKHVYMCFPKINSFFKIECKEEGTSYYKLVCTSVKNDYKWERIYTEEKEKVKVNFGDKGKLLDGGIKQDSLMKLNKFAKNEKNIYDKNRFEKMIKEEFGLGTAYDELDKLVNAGVKQIILTGAPGTGKTYTAKQYAKDYVENVREDIQKDHVGNVREDIQFVQFHSSYDYTDFVEGLRPVMIKENGKKETAFVRLDGIFKKFCRTVVENELRENSKELIGKDEQEQEWKEEYGVIRKWEEMGTKEKEGVFGLYKKKCRDEKAKEDEEAKEDENADKYFFIIDEINRADLSRVFGELMNSLEEDYRGWDEQLPETQYHNLPMYQINNEGFAEPMGFDCFKDGFFIPKNVYIIGTMNDIDRSVETFDFALRRRFRWVEVTVENEIHRAFEKMFEKKIEKTPEFRTTLKNVKECIENMNTYIIKEEGGKQFGLNQSYQIGQAYFKGFDGEKITLDNIFENRIEPLLREYCRGRDEEKTQKFIEECRKRLTKKTESQNEKKNSETSNGGVSNE